MPKLRHVALLAAVALLGAPTLPVPALSKVTENAADWPGSRAGFSVMTYNVKGLPWPIATGREPALAAIGDRLRAMRERGIQPHVVLLQEAFVDDAKRIGDVSGYPHMVSGPDSAEQAETPPLGRDFAENARWLKGERSGSVIDSGLVVLSDYPIVRTRRLAFPQGACAGYDCLASKGVLVAWVKVPGEKEPVAIADTHLNSRHSAYVPAERTDEAYGWQISTVRRFLSQVIASGSPAIFGGDFNVGQVPSRQEAIARQPLIGPDQTDGLATLVSEGRSIPTSQSEAVHILARNKDRIFSRSGSRTRLDPVRAWVPFRMSTTEHPLSDHAGFVIDYHLADQR